MIIPRETEGYGVELVRLSVRLSVCLSVRPSVRPPSHRVVCARELGMKELSFEIIHTYKPRSEVVPRQGFISIG